MITITVYVSGDGLCRIKNNLLGSLHTEEIFGTIEETRRTPYKIQAPIQIISNISEEDNEVVLCFENNEVDS